MLAKPLWADGREGSHALAGSSDCWCMPLLVPASSRLCTLPLRQLTKAAARCSWHVLPPFSQPSCPHAKSKHAPNPTCSGAHAGGAAAAGGGGGTLPAGKAAAAFRPKYHYGMKHPGPDFCGLALMALQTSPATAHLFPLHPLPPLPCSCPSCCSSTWSTAAASSRSTYWGTRMVRGHVLNGWNSTWVLLNLGSTGRAAPSLCAAAFLAMYSCGRRQWLSHLPSHPSTELIPANHIC